jgi:dTDP-L-rhamnose 4-epimerase
LSAATITPDAFSDPLQLRARRRDPIACKRGPIGSHIVDALVAEDQEVRVIDLLGPAAHASTPDYLNPGAESVQGDIKDPAVTAQALDGVHAVCRDLGTAVLLKSLDARRFRGRLVVAGSMVVYGEGGYACADHGRVAAQPRLTGDRDVPPFSAIPGRKRTHAPIGSSSDRRAQR